MTHMDSLDKIQCLSYGDNACFLYDDIDEYRNILYSFVADGLAKHERILLVIDEYPYELLLKDLNDRNIHVDYYTSIDQLVIAGKRDIYITDNSFDIDKTVENWKHQIQITKDEGYNGFRALCDMLFAADGTLETIEKLIEYEMRVHKELAKIYDNQIYICAFNKNRFPTFVLENMIKKHNVVINNSELTNPNPYFIDEYISNTEYLRRIDIRRQFSLNCKNNIGIDKDIEKKYKTINILKQVLNATGDGVLEIDLIL